MKSSRPFFTVIILLMLLVSLPASAAVTFHSVEQGRRVIIDESMEPYFSRLQPMEMLAKTAGKVTAGKLDNMRKQTREVYQQAVLDFTSEEKDTLSWYTDHYSKAFKKANPLLARTPWQFVKLDDYIEGGLPHTRANSIVLHKRMLEMLTMAKQQQGEKALQQIGSVLVHELVHVAQRRNIKPFAEVYRAWGFQQVKLASAAGWMLEHQLINPDGVNVDWIYPVQEQQGQRWILPVVTWSEGDSLRHMPQDFRMRAVSVKKNSRNWEIETTQESKPMMSDLLSIPGYRHAFPGVNSLYHPNEIIADMLTNMVLFDYFIDQKSLKPGVSDAWQKIFTPLRKCVR